MGAGRTILLLFAIFGCLPAVVVHGQDQPSLADLARKARQQKVESGAPNRDGAPKAVKVLSDDEIPDHAGDPAQPSNLGDKDRSLSKPVSASKDANTTGEQWKSRVLAQKQLIKSMQTEIDKLQASIRFEPPKGTASTERWNERQKAKMQQVEPMRARLEEQKKRLEDMQEWLRQQGYGNTIYDP